jgi:signal transduction histidine kinase/ActR/RegA family two-component response regulator
VEGRLSKATDEGKIIQESNNMDGIAQGLAPRADWRRMGESDHFVQFYETDISLIDSLGGFVATGLGMGDACVVVARESHRRGLEERLREFGLDVAAASAEGKYISLDSAETLSRFTVNGWPDRARFDAVIGGLIGRAAEGRRRVRVFGDMVSLLCGDDRHEAALRLEELWNDLSRAHKFSLFCAYPLNNFGRQSLSSSLNGVCERHSRVIPAESYTSLSCPDDRLRAIALLQQKARLLEAEVEERRQAEAALRAVKEELELQLVREQMARAEAETANRFKDEFLATVSHELRTPLNAIIGWSHLLHNGRLDEATAARAVETIERNAKAQAQLIEDILDVSRVITGKLRLNVTPVDVASVVNAAIDSVQLAADSKALQLEVTLDPSARHVLGDESRLQQVVWNLLSNAIKFTPNGGRITVRLERAGADVQIRISDTGEGIDPDFLPFIFDRFRQGDGTSTRRHGGLGLGLAIVRHLVELHGGTVCAGSPGKGGGATFTIRLPLVAAQEWAKSPEGEAARLRSNEGAQVEPLPSLDGMAVLLVDDDQDTLQMLTAMLSEYRASVHAVSSVAEALDVLRWSSPDVLVSDLAMPDEDGYSLISRVRSLDQEAGKHTPAVALTAYVRVEDRARALSAGFNLFVPKPVEPAELITAIANLAGPAAGRIGRA